MPSSYEYLAMMCPAQYLGLDLNETKAKKKQFLVIESRTNIHLFLSPKGHRPQNAVLYATTVV